MAESKQDKPDNRVQEFQHWLEISNTNGWLVYKQELEKLIDKYTKYMDNDVATGEMLKNCQMTRKGLILALNIPKRLELDAKMAKKETRNG